MCMITDTHSTRIVLPSALAPPAIRAVKKHELSGSVGNTTDSNSLAVVTVVGIGVVSA